MPCLFPLKYISGHPWEALSDRFVDTVTCLHIMSCRVFFFLRYISGHPWEALSDRLVDASSFSVSNLDAGVTYKFRAFAFSQHSFSTASQVKMYKVPGESMSSFVM